MNTVIKTFFTMFFCATLCADKYIAAFNPGTIHGYRQAIVLEALEAAVGQKTSKIFDFMGGTSTGAIIAALASFKSGEDESGYRASDIRRMYEEVGRSIFSTKKTTFLRDVLKEKGYDESNLPFVRLRDEEKLKWISFTPGFHLNVDQTLAMFDDAYFSNVLAYYLGAQTKLGDATLPIALFAKKYRIDKFYPEILAEHFRIFDVQGEILGINSFEHADIGVVDAVRASTARLNLFGPYEFELDKERQVFVDAANQISTLKETIHFAKKTWPGEKLYVFYFLGNPRIEGSYESILQDFGAYFIDDVKIFSLGITYLGSKAVHRYFEDYDVSAEHFETMAQETSAFIETSVEFERSVKQIRSKFVEQAVSAL